MRASGEVRPTNDGLFRRGWQTYRGRWWAAAATVLGGSLLSVVLLTLALLALGPLAVLQRDLAFDGVALTFGGVVLIGLEVGIPTLLLLALLGAATVAALVRVLDGAASAQRVDVGRLLRSAVRHAARVLGTLTLLVLGTVGLALAAPLLVVAGLVGLLVVAAFRVLRREAPFSARVCLRLAVPFATAARFVFHGALGPIVAALEGAGPVAALRRSRELLDRAEPAPRRTLVLTAIGYVVVDLSLSIVVGLIGAEALPLVWGRLVAQALLMPIPAAVAVALYRGTRRPADPPIQSLPVRHRSLRRLATAAAVALALVIPLASVAMPTAPAAAADSPMISVEVLGGPSTTSGLALTLVATVTGAAPGAVVHFRTDGESGRDLGTATVDDATGRAVVDYVELPPGTHTIIAELEGTGLTDATSHTVESADTDSTLTVTSAGNVAVGEPAVVNFTLTSAAGTPSGGRLLVSVGSPTAWPLTVTVGGDGRAQASVLGLPAGTHSIYATYTGSAPHRHTSAQGTVTVATQASIATSVTASATPQPAYAGADVVVTATVLAGGQPVPAGVVRVSGSWFATQDVTVTAQGVAAVTLAAPAPGADAVVSLNYLGTDDYRSSASQLTLDSRNVPYDVTIDDDLGSMDVGQTITVTARLSESAVGRGLPTSGQATLLAGDLEVATVALTGLNVVTFTVDTPADLGVGTHRLAVRVDGAAGFEAVTSAALPVTVVGRETEVRLDGPASSHTGDTVTVTARVEVALFDDLPTGQIVLTGAGDPITVTVTPRAGATGEAEAVFELTGLAAGTHHLSAEFVPTDSYLAGSTRTFSHTVAGRALAVTAVLPPQTPAGRDLTVWVTVAETGVATLSARQPDGTVAVSVDGTPAVAAVPLAGVTVHGSRAQVTIPGGLLTRGDHDIQVSYVSTGVHASTTAEVGELEALGRTPQLRASTDPGVSHDWGSSVPVVVEAGHPADFFDVLDGDLPAPSISALTLAGHNGGTCTADPWVCRWSGPGAAMVVTTFGGDDFYAPHSNTQTITTLSSRTPVVAATVTPASAAAGQDITIWWEVTGPTVGQITMDINGVGVICGIALSGECTVPMPNLGNGVAAVLTVAYTGGTPSWRNAQWSSPMTSIECVPFSTTAVSTEGRLTLTPAPSCGQGAGYPAGTTVLAVATPAASGDASYQWVASRIRSWTGTEWLDLGGTRTRTGALETTFTVGTGAGQVSSAYAVFESSWNCATVELVTRRYSAATVNFLDSVTSPTCPGAGPWSSVSTVTFDGVRERVATGSFLVGDTIALSSPRLPNSESYGTRWSGVVGMETTAVAVLPTTVVVAGQTRIEASFGPVCHAVRFATEGPGTVSVQTSPNCRDPRRADQYVAQTVVEYIASPDAAAHPLAYFAGAVGADDVPLRRQWGRSGPLASGESGFHSATAWSSIDVTARFEHCVGLRIEPLGTSAPLASTDSNCPVAVETTPGTSWSYRPGTQVSMWATLPDGLRLGRWNTTIDGVAATLPNEEYLASRRFVITADTLMRPSFVTSTECAPFVIVAQPGGQVEVTDLGPTGEQCAIDTLLDGPTSSSLEGAVGRVGGALTAKATTDEGSPLIGWKVSGYGITPYATPGEEVTVQNASWHPRTVKMVTCQTIEAYVGITDLVGTPNLGRQNYGTFVAVSPAPNCPFDPTAWTVGTTLTVTAGADARAYAFTGWGGAAGEGTELATSLVLDGQTQSVSVRAMYQVVCHVLTVSKNPQRVTPLPAPNCPGAPEPSTTAGVWTGSYIGGTPVALIGEVPGGNVWQGWAGDVVERGKVSVAVVLMDADKDVQHRYRGKTTEEDIAGFFDDVGNAMAVAGKKIVGGLATAVPILLGTVLGPVLTALELVSALGDLLDEVGVPSEVTQLFRLPAQSVNFAIGATRCVGHWGLSSGSSGNVDASAANDAIEQVGIEEMVARQGYSPTDHMLEAGLDYVPGLFGVDGEWTDAAREFYYEQKFAIMTEFDPTGASAVYGALTEITGSLSNGPGVGWDASASDAWSTSGFTDVMGSCLAAYTPDVLRGAVPGDQSDANRDYWGTGGD